MRAADLVPGEVYAWRPPGALPRPVICMGTVPRLEEPGQRRRFPVAAPTPGPVAGVPVWVPRYIRIRDLTGTWAEHEARLAEANVLSDRRAAEADTWARKQQERRDEVARRLDDMGLQPRLLTVSGDHAEVCRLLELAEAGAILKSLRAANP